MAFRSQAQIRYEVEFIVACRQYLKLLPVLNIKILPNPSLIEWTIVNTMVLQHDFFRNDWNTKVSNGCTLYGIIVFSSTLICSQAIQRLENRN